MLNKILDVTRKITNIIVTFLFMVVVAVVFAQVVARYVAGSSSWPGLHLSGWSIWEAPSRSGKAEMYALIYCWRHVREKPGR